MMEVDKGTKSIVKKNLYVSQRKQFENAHSYQDHRDILLGML